MRIRPPAGAFSGWSHLEAIQNCDLSTVGPLGWERESYSLSQPLPAATASEWWSAKVPAVSLCPISVKQQLHGSSGKSWKSLHQSSVIGTERQQKRPVQTPWACLFCNMRAKTSSRDFVVVQQGKQGMIFGIWPTIPPRPLLCVYFNYSLHFAWKL